MENLAKKVEKGKSRTGRGKGEEINGYKWIEKFLRFKFLVFLAFHICVEKSAILTFLMAGN